MISDSDRSYWFGASDVGYIIAKNKSTATFKKWWLEKLGLIKSNFSNNYTIAGNNYEHKILDALGIEGMKKDRQIIMEELNLRVNLDGNTDTAVYEVKTFKEENGFSPGKYIKQVQVQLYASKLPGAYITAYPLRECDYKNFFNPVERERVILHEVEYDQKFIDGIFLPNLIYCRECLLSGTMPGEYKEDVQFRKEKNDAYTYRDDKRNIF